MFLRPRTAPRPVHDRISEPDTTPHAAPITYRMSCDVCGALSHTSVEFGTVQDRQLHHAAHHPGHDAYTQTVTRPWRTRAPSPAH